MYARSGRAAGCGKLVRNCVSQTFKMNPIQKDGVKVLRKGLANRLFEMQNPENRQEEVCSRALLCQLPAG